MRCFRSQLAEQPYDQRIAALNCYRGYSLGAGVRAAEAFFVATAAGLAPTQEPAHLEAELAACRRELEAMRASRSWGMTAPLRWLGRRLRRA
jgi:hypothetical protein